MKKRPTRQHRQRRGCAPSCLTLTVGQRKMTEDKFISSIDARFPYGEPKKARALAARALKISPGAVYAVYHELARPGRSVRTSSGERLTVLEWFEERFVHPLSGLGAWLARKSIAKEELSVQQAATVAHIIAPFTGCYGILNLAYFTCDDKHGKNERLFDSIRSRWEKEPNSERSTRRVLLRRSAQRDS